MKLFIIYHPAYDFPLTVPDFLKFHPFDAQKYRKIATTVKRRFPRIQFDYPDHKLTELDLLTVHTAEQIERFKDKAYLSKSIDFPYILKFVPYATIKRCLLDPMLWAAAGTVKAMHIALEQGVAINLGGGYHHAKLENPVGDNGGCLIADIPLACEIYHSKFPQYRIAIIDLDIHQGNGLEDYAKNNPNVYILDIYNKNEYPWDNDNTIQYAHTAIPLDGGHLESKIPFLGYALDVSKYDFLSLIEQPVNRRVNDKEYLDKLYQHLPDFLDKVEPQLVFYNAGTDPYENDPWGCTALSKEGIIERDEFVFQQVRHRGIPLVMTLSGGYAKDSADLIAESIVNLAKMPETRDAQN